MKVIRYHSPEGQRSGLLVSTGTKFHHVILIDNPIRVHKIPVSEERWFTDVQLNGNPYPVARAVRHFRNIVKRYHGGMRNVSKDVREALQGGAVMRVTRARVEQAIRDKYGADVKLFKGNGYWYFIPAESWLLGCMGGTSVYVMTLGEVDVDWWVGQFENLFDGGCWSGNYIVNLILGKT